MLYFITMKQLLTIFLALSLLCGCTTDAERSRMRSGLDSINQRNRNDQPFTVADVQPYADFFDRHGTANDRLLAHYLLGRAYYDAGEAPMALQCYQQAIECADTTAKDCDFAQLSKVYAQMGQLFYSQALYQQQIEVCKMASHFALLADRSQSAIIDYEQLTNAYEASGKIDSAIYVIDSVASWYNLHNDIQNAAIAYGRSTSILLHLSDYKKARKLMDYYEQHSGFFDRQGNILKGREIYYYYKGLLLLHEGKTDSAELYFRKELQNGYDYSNQNSGAKGLALLYEKAGISDSAAKYYRYSYEMLDSLFSAKVTEEVNRVNTLYDYTRNQKIAQQKTEEAQHEKNKRRFFVTLFMLSSLVATVIILALLKKSKAGLEKYKESFRELQQISSERDALFLHKNEYAQLIAEKEKKIQQLENVVKKYGKQLYFTTANAERCLKESATYQIISGKAIRGEHLTADFMSKANQLASEYFPTFDDFIATYRSILKPEECNICILLRLHFKPIEISGMLCMSKSLVSQNCTNVMKKIFNEKGSSKELSAKLSNLF